jgi:hypothetical protein
MKLKGEIDRADNVLGKLTKTYKIQCENRKERDSVEDM